MKHYDIGQVNYTLGAIMFVGLTIGIDAGRILVFALEEIGIAGIGLLFLHQAHEPDDACDTDSSEDDMPAIANRIQSYTIPPMVALVSGGRASAWTISGVGGVVGLVSGLLGVGGGFICMPAIYYLIGTPLTVAVGTSLFAGLFSGAFGTFTYGLSGSVDLVVVTTLLVGSALGARIGSAATTMVDEDEVIVYFGIMMLLASLAIGLSEVGRYLQADNLELVSIVLLVGSSFVVAGIVLYRFAIVVRTPLTDRTVG